VEDCFFFVRFTVSLCARALLRKRQSSMSARARTPNLEHVEQRLRRLQNLHVSGFSLLNGFIVLIPGLDFSSERLCKQNKEETPPSQHDGNVGPQTSFILDNLSVKMLRSF
jgi:hypothetical protein